MHFKTKNTEIKIEKYMKINIEKTQTHTSNGLVLYEPISINIMLKQLS